MVKVVLYCIVLYCTVLTMEEELEISEMGDMFSKNICLASTEEDCCPLCPASSPLDRRESTCSRAVVMVIPRCSIQSYGSPRRRVAWSRCCCRSPAGRRSSCWSYSACWRSTACSNQLSYDHYIITMANYGDNAQFGPDHLPLLYHIMATL